MESAIERKILKSEYTLTSAESSAVLVNQKLISMLCELDERFTIAEVVTSTSSKYEVLVQFMDYPFYLDLYNPDSSLNSFARVDKNGSYVSLTGSSYTSGVLAYYSSSRTTIIGVEVHSIGDSIVSVKFTNSYGNGSGSYRTLCFAIAYSQYLEDYIYLFNQYGSSASVPTSTNSIFANTIYVQSLSMDDVESQQIKVNYLSEPKTSMLLADPDQDTVLVPFGYSGYVDNKYWFGDLTFDGYRLKVSYDSAGLIAPDPDITYSVNGIEYLGVFSDRLIIPFKTTVTEEQV